MKYMGVVGSRWAPRSSKPVAGRVAGRGGFDSHPLPPYYYLMIKFEYREPITRLMMLYVSS